MEDDLPSRSKDGLSALDIFYAGFNEINFYVEDQDQENLYEKILKTSIPQVSISRIFPLGGKHEVIRHATDPANSSISAYRVYILDKDFEDFLGNIVYQDNIFYLDRFCIENYLLDEQALVEVVLEEHPREKANDISSSLDLTPVINGLLSDFFPLFLVFLFVQKFSLPLRNCGEPPERFCFPNRLWVVNQSAIVSYTHQVSKVCSSAKIPPPSNDIISDGRLSPASSCDWHLVVSGKYVMSGVFHYIKSRYRFSHCTMDSLIYRIAKNSTLDAFKPFADRIIRSYQAWKSAREMATR